MAIDPKKFGTIGVLMGGYSSEREISLRSGKAVAETLQQAGAAVKALDVQLQEPDAIRDFLRQARIDVAFIALHGRLGEDGTIQAILQELRLPYTGSGVAASRTAINKAATQTLFKEQGIPVPELVIVNDKTEKHFFLNGHLKFPVVVKPACEGSSIGVKIVHEKEELGVALREAFGYGNEVLVERFIPGRELTVGILGTKALPVIEVIPKTKFFDFSAKYQSGETRYDIPARISDRVAGNVQELALRAFHALGCRHLSRVDVMLEDERDPYVLEINTIPGFTSTSLLPKAARVIGLDFAQLCLNIVEMAYGEKR